MPVEFWTEAGNTLIAGAIVAAVAVPVGFVAWRIARQRGEPLLLPSKPWRVPWGGLEVFLAFLVLHGMVPLAFVSSGMDPLAVGVVALPIQIALLVAAWFSLYPAWKPVRRRAIAAPIALAVIAWALLTPPILAFFGAVLQLFSVLHWQPDEHPLTKLGELTPLAQWLFFLQACLAAPLIEEILFRGLLLPWAIGARERHTGRPPIPLLAPPVIRPWLVMAFAVAVAAKSTRLDPVLFAATLAGGLAVIWVAVRRGKRHVRGVYASAALFAVVHSAIWPSPLPLFLLGLGLGWLAVRTRGILVPVLVHSLFNAVATIQVLRSGAG